MRSCAHCGWPIVDGRARTFCDSRCRKAAFRRRRQGLPENALAERGRHGRRSLAESADREQLQAAARELETAARRLSDSAVSAQRKARF